MRALAASAIAGASAALRTALASAAVSPAPGSTRKPLTPVLHNHIRPRRAPRHRHAARVHRFEQTHAEDFAVVAVEKDVAGVVVGLHFGVRQLRNLPPAVLQAVFLHRFGQRAGKAPLPDHNGLPGFRQGGEHRRNVERALVGIEPADEQKIVRVFIQAQPPAQRRARLGNFGDDRGIEPHRQHAGAGHAQSFELVRDGLRLGIGRGAAVNCKVAPAEQIHDPAHGRVLRLRGQRAELAVKEDAVRAAEPVEPRHREGVIPHDVDRVNLFVKQRLPAFEKGVDAEGFGRAVEHLDLLGRGFDLNFIRARRGVEHDSPGPQRRKRPRQADFLPVVGPALAGCPAVELRDRDGQHGYLLQRVAGGGSWAKYRASMTSKTSSLQ